VYFAAVHGNDGKGEWARAIFARTENLYDATALAYAAGDAIYVLEKPATGEWLGRNARTGLVGHFPFTEVELPALGL
jgi:hypothetical protein